MLTLCVSVQVEQCNIQECPCRCKPSVKRASERALSCVSACRSSGVFSHCRVFVSLCEPLTAEE